MMTITPGSRVTLHMKETLRDGTLVGTTAGNDPVELTIGKSDGYQPIQNSLIGMEEGDTREVLVPCEQAYGPIRDDLIFELDDSRIPEHVDATPGKHLLATTKAGKSMEVTVVTRSNDKVKLNANHPLAGKDLVFEIHVLQVSR